MKFFIPFAEDEKEAESVYNSIKEFLKTEYSRFSSDERIYSIEFTRDGIDYKETVGEKFQLNGETIIAILQCNGIHHVCTKNRGVLKNEPMIAFAKSVEYFENQ